MTELVAHGLGVTLPSGWEARLSRRPQANAFEQGLPVLHLASFPLPEQRDDFGGDVTSSMRSSDAFIVLFEHGTEAAGRSLFQTEGVPAVTADMFSPNRLQRRLAGQLGCQHFFSVNGRAFCLYVVAGSRASLPGIVNEVNHALRSLQVGTP